jgi:chromosome segregation ATPase
MEDARELQKRAARLRSLLANLKLDLEKVERDRSRLQERIRVLQQQLQRASDEVRWDRSQRICLGKKRNGPAAEADAT